MFKHKCRLIQLSFIYIYQYALSRDTVRISLLFQWIYVFAEGSKLKGITNIDKNMPHKIQLEMTLSCTDLEGL